MFISKEDDFKSPKKTSPLQFKKNNGNVFLEDGLIINDEEKYFNNDLNYQFTADIDKHLGEFDCKFYTLSRRYLKTECQRKNLRLYYTKATPKKIIKAQFLLIHGFGEHSSRYMQVRKD